MQNADQKMVMLFQRLGLIGLKAGDVSFTTSNDTGIMGGGGTDKGQTGNGTLNIGGDKGFSFFLFKLYRFLQYGSRT